MSVYRMEGENLKKLNSLFEGWNETLLWSCLQGFMGTAWADNRTNPESAQIVIADFCFFAGKANELFVKNRPQSHKSDFVIMVPQNEEWAKLIEAEYGANATKVIRYAIKKEPEVFPVEKLKAMIEEVSKDYDIRLIDQNIFEATRASRWSADLCAQFESFDEYFEKGLGVAALYNGELVSGASSYTVYQDGIEIEIDTREDYRRKGLALACAAKLILECMDRGLYPSWDAQNKGSVALAEKLGYHFDKEYIAYEVIGYGCMSALAGLASDQGTDYEIDATKISVAK